jgi:uncharacterized protein YdaU (DUF1376 family)
VEVSSTLKNNPNNNKKQKIDLVDTYFVDKLVELEEKRLEEQMKLERERMEHESKAKEAQIAFQRDMLAIMQMQAERGVQHQQYPAFNQVQPGHSLMPQAYFHGGNQSFTDKNKQC